jgi:hypothetical protein
VTDRRIVKRCRQTPVSSGFPQEARNRSTNSTEGDVVSPVGWGCKPLFERIHRGEDLVNAQVERALQRFTKLYCQTEGGDLQVPFGGERIEQVSRVSSACRSPRTNLTNFAAWSD